MDELERGLTSLETRSKLSLWMIGLFGVCSLAFILSGIVLLAIGIVGNETALQAYAITAVASSVSFVLSALAICFWIHRAHANLYLFGHEGLEFTPGWSVGWFFVPFANLVKPFEAMRELWVRVLGETTGLLGLWWGTFLVGGIVENIGSRFVDNLEEMRLGIPMLAAGSALRVASAICLFLIIRAISRAQNGTQGLGETFA